jgi:hypothetical protein
MKNIFSIFLIALFITSCEEEIILALPDTTGKAVVEGYIQPSYPIFLQLTRSSGYFDEISENELANVFIDNAEVSVTRMSDGVSKNLSFIEIPGIFGFYTDAKVSSIEELISLSHEDFDATFAIVGERYKLEVIYNNDTITSVTGIPNIETEAEKMIDSVWFVEDPLFPNYGDFYFSYNDADTIGNNIMLESKRIKHYVSIINDNDTTILNEPDFLFVKALWGKVRNDFEGFNGVKNFVSYFDRGESEMFSLGMGHGEEKDALFGNFQTEHINHTTGLIISADEVLIRISQIEVAPFEFWRSTEFQEQMNGNPFSEPMNLQHNIVGGFGVWEGKGAIYYKVIAKKDTTFTKRYTPDIFESF